MEYQSFYLILADALLFLHVLVVLFLVIGLVAIYAGKVLAWSWVRNPWFRIMHIVVAGFIVLQSWMGFICPLTIWEMSLRNQANDAVYTGSFIAHWLAALLYYQAPAWVFTFAYTVFGVMVLAGWFFVRPRSFRGS